MQYHELIVLIKSDQGVYNEKNFTIYKTYNGGGNAFDIFKDADLCTESGVWKTSLNTFTTARSVHTSAIYNKRLYIIGGQDGTNTLSDVQYASINSDGSVGSWTAISSFTTARSNHASVIHNGYIYILGGYDGWDTLNDVQYAPINSDWSFGTWTTTTSFTTERCDHTSVVHNGFIYIIGGHTGSDYYSDIQYAPINSDGTIGSWTTTSLHEARSRHTSHVNNGILYVIGGEDSSDERDDVKYVSLKSDGSLGTWQTASSLSHVRAGHSSVILNGKIFVIGGYYYDNNDIYLDSVICTTINSDGSLGSWQTSSTLPAVNSFSSGVVYNNYIYLTGGYNGTSLLNNMQYIRFCD